MKRADGVLPSALLQEGLAELAPAGAKKIQNIFVGGVYVGKNQPSTGRKPVRRTASPFGAFCPFLLGGRQPACVQKNKNPSKIQGCPMRSSSAGAEMLADEERPQRILCVFSRALTQYEGISARQNRMFSCLSMANSARKRASRASALRRTAFSQKGALQSKAPF